MIDLLLRQFVSFKGIRQLINRTQFMTYISLSSFTLGLLSKYSRGVCGKVIVLIHNVYRSGNIVLCKAGGWWWTLIAGVMSSWRFYQVIQQIC